MKSPWRHEREHALANRHDLPRGAHDAENALALERTGLHLVGLVLALLEKMQQSEVNLARGIVRPLAKLILIKRDYLVEVAAIDAKLEERAIAQNRGHLELGINWRYGLGNLGRRHRADRK